MIAIDTNVLLRRLLDDDETQADKARRLFDSGELLLITDIVLAETVWTLKGKRYGVSRDEIADAIVSLMEEPHVIFESKQAVWSALNDYLAAVPVKTANGPKQADFADALIVNKAKHVANLRGERYSGTYTFDQGALGIAGTRKP